MASESSLNISQSKYDHTDKIAVRRKALFPTTKPKMTGRISPISDSSSNFSDVFLLDPLDSDNQYILQRKMDDYDIFEENSNDISKIMRILTTPSENTMSPLCLSPCKSSPLTYSPQNTVMPITPIGKSPTSKLKTPHDTSTVKLNVKQPKRKLMEAIVNIEKEKSPDTKLAKLETLVKSSKARTALFTENFDISLPVKSFYSKATQRVERPPQEHIKKISAPKHKETTYLCRRMKRRYGQINAGVRHKIKKPRQKKVAKANITKAALNIIAKSPLNEYLEEMALMKTIISPKQKRKIDIIKSNNSVNKENQEIPEEEITYDNTKKFFKSCRNKKGVVSLSKNIKVQVGNTGMTIIDNKMVNNKVENTAGIKEDENKRASIKRKLDDLTEDLSESLGVYINIDEILKSLNKSPEKEEEVDLLQKPGLILSPTSQMCDMASGLALNSPKRAKLNINTLLDKTNNVFNASSVDMEEQRKLFPIFYGGANTAEVKSKVSTRNSGLKKWKNLPEDQMLLDAGQKKFGMTQCYECESVYHMGDPNDELRHFNYHNSITTFKFNGWKNERIIKNFIDGRIIKIVPGDSNHWWKKVKDLLIVINRDLGYYQEELSVDQGQVYLYIKNKAIVGCIVAERKEEGYQMLSSDLGIDLCSELPYPIICGISRIWVSQSHRKSGIASRMMDCLRYSFINGILLGSKEIALSSPTEQGKLFAAKYFKTDNYLIYFS